MIVRDESIKWRLGGGFKHPLTHAWPFPIWPIFSGWNHQWPKIFSSWRFLKVIDVDDSFPTLHISEAASYIPNLIQELQHFTSWTWCCQLHGVHPSELAPLEMERSYWILLAKSPDPLSQASATFGRCLGRWNSCRKKSKG